MLTDHRSKFAKSGTRIMCSFRSCQTRFEFLSQFRKVRNAFERFITQVQTRLPKTKCVWPMKINVICTVGSHYVPLLGFIYSYFAPNIPFWSRFRLVYLYFPIFSFIYLYLPNLALFAPIWLYIPLIAII